MQVKDIKISENTKNILLIAGIGIVAYVIYKVVNKVGEAVEGVKSAGQTVTDSISAGEKSKKIDDKVLENTKPKSPWSPDYYKNNLPKGTPLFKVATATGIADKIYKEFGQTFFAPSLSNFYKIMSTVQYRQQLSQIADVFEKKYNKNMLQYVQSGAKRSGWTNLVYSTEMDDLVNYGTNLKDF